MSHLWSGRFDGEPDPDVFEFGRSFPFDRRLFEDDVTGSLAWVEALAPAGAIRPDEAHAIADALREILARGVSEPSCVGGPDEDVHAFVERELVERLGDGGQAPAHRAFAQRAGVGRPAPVPEAAHSRAAAGGSRRSSLRSLGQAAAAGEARDAGLHAPAARAAGARRALLAGARGRASPRSRPLRPCDPTRPTRCRSARARSPARSYAIDTQALARRLGFSRVAANSIDASSDRDFVAVVPARVRAGDGAPQPPGRGPRPVHERGVRLLRAVRRGRDRQQPDAAEEEPGPARARSAARPGA